MKNLPLTDAQFADLMREVQREHARRQAKAARPDYTTPHGIVRFVTEIIGATPTAYQERILRAFVQHKRVAVRSPHGAGKTTTAAWIVLWALYAFECDVKIPTTASAWRQLELFLWPEIRKWARLIDWPSPRPRLLSLKILWGDKSAFAVASDTPELIEGAHAAVVLYVFDEAKAIPAGIWDAAEGAFSTAGHDTDSDAYALAISTPGPPTGRFYDIHARKPGLQDWHTEHVTLTEAIQAGRISRQWATQRAEQWGKHSAVYQNRVEGEFATQDEDSVIPLAWVEAAVNRWHEAKGRASDDAPLSYGVDPARYGDDKTVVARLAGNVLESLSYHSKQDTMQTAGQIAATANRQTPIAVDVIGIGAGVVDRLSELSYTVTGVNAAAAAKTDSGQPLTDKTGTFEFVNMRSYLWWLMRDMLDPAKGAALALPDDDALIGDLTAPGYTYTSAGKIKVEGKDDIRKRIKRSTDAADALALALYVAHAAAGYSGAGASRRGFAILDDRDRTRRRAQRGSTRNQGRRPRGYPRW